VFEVDIGCLKVFRASGLGQILDVMVLGASGLGRY